MTGRSAGAALTPGLRSKMLTALESTRIMLPMSWTMPAVIKPRAVNRKSSRSAAA
jgi:hypothetical protein